jgi:hypothetical protein
MILKEEKNIAFIKGNVIRDIYKLFLDINSKINLQARELKYMKLYCYSLFGNSMKLCFLNYENNVDCRCLRMGCWGQY